MQGQELDVVPEWVVLDVAPADTGRCAPCRLIARLSSLAALTNPAVAPDEPRLQAADALSR
ncbi:hypothetical protein Aau02nite_16810 [Amorphoplanes auranticolor]|uniref:Uncharacterized protein n=1 Tax=Actinoplanes auranticolor TaxID=47988 RepID=A0A919S6L7_9ACTN|nr:hypothetical protein Aau02nite_16810 [Actinoplanes auranticolor]